MGRLFVYSCALTAAWDTIVMMKPILDYLIVSGCGMCHVVWLGVAALPMSGTVNRYHGLHVKPHLP